MRNSNLKESVRPTGCFISWALYWKLFQLNNPSMNKQSSLTKEFTESKVMLKVSLLLYRY